MLGSFLVIDLLTPLPLPSGFAGKSSSQETTNPSPHTPAPPNLLKSPTAWRLFSNSQGVGDSKSTTWHLPIVQMLKCLNADWHVKILKFWNVEVLNCCYPKMVKCSNAEKLKCWNTEMINCLKSKMLNCWNDEMLECWNAEILKCWIPEMLKF